MNQTSADRTERWQQLSLVYAVMVCLVLLILLQTLMLNIAVEGYLGGVDKVLLPATVGSGICLACSIWLVSYVFRMQRKSL